MKIMQDRRHGWRRVGESKMAMLCSCRTCPLRRRQRRPPHQALQDGGWQGGVTGEPQRAGAVLQGEDARGTQLGARCQQQAAFRQPRQHLQHIRCVHLTYKFDLRGMSMRKMRAGEKTRLCRQVSRLDTAYIMNCRLSTNTIWRVVYKDAVWCPEDAV